MRLSPLASTIILALLTGALAIGIWALMADHFNPPGTATNVVNNSTPSNLTDPGTMALHMPMQPDGWVLNNSTGETVIDNPDSFSYAKNDYLRPHTNTTASVIIYDSGGGNIMWDGIYKTGFIYDDNSGFAKVLTYKGMLAWKTGKYGNDGNTYSLYVKLNDRYGVAILLRNASDSSPLMDFADRINVYKIKTMKK